MSRTIDIGIASYGKDAAQLERTVRSVVTQTRNAFRLFIIHNPSEGDEATRAAIQGLSYLGDNITAVFMDSNLGYAGAVNELFHRAQSDIVFYLDNDVEINTSGWDEKFCAVLDANPEVGQVFPGAGHYGFNNGKYHECLWNAGYCWALRKSACSSSFRLWASDGVNHEGSIMDWTLGHHEEVDLMIRLRLAGYRIACCPDVDVKHLCVSTNADDSAHKPGGRIHDGVVRFMNKWCRYFFGDELKYSMTAYDPRFIRYNEWPPCALYMERFAQHHFPSINANPRSVTIPGVGVMDLIEVLRTHDTHKGRSI